MSSTNNYLPAVQQQQQQQCRTPTAFVRVNNPYATSSAQELAMAPTASGRAPQVLTLSAIRRLSSCLGPLRRYDRQNSTKLNTFCLMSVDPYEFADASAVAAMIHLAAKESVESVSVVNPGKVHGCSIFVKCYDAAQKQRVQEALYLRIQFARAASGEVCLVLYSQPGDAPAALPAGFASTERIPHHAVQAEDLKPKLRTPQPHSNTTYYHHTTHTNTTFTTTHDTHYDHSSDGSLSGSSSNISTPPRSPSLEARDRNRRQQQQHYGALPQRRSYRQ